MTAPVTRVEYVIRDRKHFTQFAWTVKRLAIRDAKECDRLYPDDAPHRVLKRTITEVEVTP